MPERVQLQRKKGWRMPPNTVIVARPSRWGNPWKVWKDDVGSWVVTWNGCQHRRFTNRDAAQAFAVQQHREELERMCSYYGTVPTLMELRGKNLACWCKPGTPCHADTLLALANPNDQHNRPASAGPG